MRGAGGGVGGERSRRRVAGRGRAAAAARPAVARRGRGELVSSEATGADRLEVTGPIGRPGPTWRGDAVTRPAVEAAGVLAAEPTLIEPCSLRRRLVCFAIDQALVWGIVLVLTSVALAAAGIGDEPTPGTREERIFQATGLISLVAPFFYFWVWNSAGFSPGKQMLGVRIVTAEGAPPGVARGFSRTVASLLVPLTLGLSYAWAAWDTDAERPFAEGYAQAWHDKLSGTFIVRA
ncbi:MAG: RDD family protein [Chloroflexi bacterium]|nr:RDD family protein [Chloroflexota bacterium]